MTEEAAFAELPAELRADVARLEGAARRIEAAPPRGRLAAVRAEATGERGFTEESIRRKFYRWLRSGRDWRALVDRARAPHARRAERDALGEAYRSYAEGNQRASRPGWRKMMRDFEAGAAFAGVGDWRAVWERENPGRTAPEAYPRGWVPRGWGYASLQARYGLTGYERAAARRGAAAAAAYAPPVRTTRAGLLPGQVYQFDDVWHDIKVLLPGASRELSRPLEWACVDVASTNKVDYFLRAQVRREDGGRDSLKRWQFKALVWDVLTRVGYHRDGCVFVVEHGSAGLTDAEKAKVTDASAGKVTFRSSGILGRPLLAGLWPGQGHGNFKAKALLEGSHRLIHYEAAGLPGQTGGNSRADAPEGLFGLEAHAEEMMRAFGRVPPEFRGLLEAGALPFSAYARLADDLYRVIYGRTDHRIEGWETNGWVRAEWSPDGRGGWRDAAEIPLLPEAIRPMAEAAMRAPGLHRLRRLSPAEAWATGAGGLARLPAWALVDFLGDDCRVRARVGRDGLITFQNRELTGSEDPWRYLALAQAPGGEGVPLAAGREVWLHVSPLSAEAVAEDSSTGSVLGTVRRWASVSVLTPGQMEAAVEAQARMAALEARGYRERHAAEARDAEAVRQAQDAAAARPGAAGRGEPAGGGLEGIRALEGENERKEARDGNEEW